MMKVIKNFVDIFMKIFTDLPDFTEAVGVLQLNF
jgi:hypothetical protein